MRRITGLLLLPPLDVLAELLQGRPEAGVPELLGEGVDLPDRVVVAALGGQRGRRLVDLRIVGLRDLLVAAVVVVLQRADLRDARRPGLRRGLDREPEFRLQLREALELRVRGDGALEFVDERRQLARRLLALLLPLRPGVEVLQLLLERGPPAGAPGLLGCGQDEVPGDAVAAGEFLDLQISGAGLRFRIRGRRRAALGAGDFGSGPWGAVPRSPK
jgi:hypothetical protein